MKLHPLRVGNVIVDFEDSPYYFRVEGTNNNHCIVYRKGGSVSYSIDDHRIELSEPILLALGFEVAEEQIGERLLKRFPLCLKNSSGQERKIHVYALYDNEDVYFSLYVSGDYVLAQDFRYLDQLQNIIFDLFGIDIVEDETKLPL